METIAKETPAQLPADHVDADPSVPVVGSGATFVLWTDCYACTVIKVSDSGATAWLRRDKATLLNAVNSGAPDALHFDRGGFVGHTSGVQRYEYTPDPDGTIYRVTRRTLRDGGIAWKQSGHRTKAPGASAIFGRRSEHYDYNF